MKTSKVKIKKSITVFTAIISIAVLFLSSCKNDKNDEPAMVPGQTSIRLVHSSSISKATLLDLYVDDVKVSAQSIAYPGASGYLPATSGSKKITVKNAAGTVIKDTTLNIQDGHQYSVFVKEWRHYSVSTTTPSVITITPAAKQEVVISDDNNTSVPSAGEAKVRFVNSIGSNDFFSTSSWPAIFFRVNAPGPLPVQEYLTYNLTNKPSDFLSIKAGPVTFRASALNSTNVATIVTMTETMLEAGKLYTVYLMGSPGGAPPTGGAAVPPTLELKIVATN